MDLIKTQDDPKGDGTLYGLTPASWVLIITTIGTILTNLVLQVTSMVLNYNERVDRKADSVAVAQKVDEVTAKQTEAVAEVKTAIDTKAAEHDDKLNVMLRKVDEVKTKVME